MIAGKHVFSRVTFYLGTAGFLIWFLYTYEQTPDPTYIGRSVVILSSLLLVAAYHLKRNLLKYAAMAASFAGTMALLFTGIYDWTSVIGIGYLSLILFAHAQPYAFSSFFVPIGYILWMKQFMEVIPGRLLSMQILEIAGAFTVINILFLAIRKLQRQRDTYRRLSRTEPMTGLFSSEYLLQVGSKWIEEKRPFRLYWIDLDRFKQVNDTYGHSFGDQVLIRISNVLLELAILNGGVAGRMGGDEFAMLVPLHVRNKQLTQRLQRRLNHELLSINPELPTLNLQFSLGECVSMPDDGRSMEDLLRDADAKMYQMKYDRKTLLSDKALEKYVPDLTLQHLLQSLGEKDSYTFMQSKHAVEMGLKLAVHMGLDEQTTAHLVMACWLHDVGKMFIPSPLLRKSEHLADEELSVLKSHVGHGLRMLNGLNVPEPVLQAIATHHERWDGEGYPMALNKDEIPLLGRLLQIIDAYAAMTTQSIFRDLRSVEETLAEIEGGAGTQFDPELAKQFVSFIRSNEGSLAG